jgi:hypothetical protein
VLVAGPISVSVQVADTFDEDCSAVVDVEQGDVAYAVVHSVWDPPPEPGEHRLRAVTAGPCCTAGAVRGLYLHLKDELARSSE